MRRGTLCLALLAWLSSCGLHLPMGMEDAEEGVAGRGSIAIIVENLSSQAIRTIAPGHISVADLRAQYELRLSGTTGYRSFPEEVVTIAADGRGALRDLPEGEWELTLTAYSTAGNLPVLRGRASVSVSPLEVTPASFTLSPLLTGDGTVRVQFTLPDSVVRRLDPQGNASKQVTVALYYDEVDAEVPGTKQVYTMTAGGTINYTANNGRVPEGRYTIRLFAPYTVNNASTLFMDMTYSMGFQDVLYVEGNRESAASIAIPEMELPIPGKPYRWDKVTSSVTVPSTNGNTNATTFSSAFITGSQSFRPYGEGLWAYPGNWDGSGGNTPTNPNGPNGGRAGSTQGNEVLLITWDAVYDADYYELEVLLHPNYGRNNNNGVSNAAKYDKLPANDSDWQQFLQKSPSPLKLRFSGGSGDPDNYKTKAHSYLIYGGGSARDVQFEFVAWRGIADGKNSGYKTSTGSSDGSFISPPDASGLSRRGSATYRIGLEGDCNALAILMHNFAPQHWYGIRLRAVNEFGYSEWVYWKGGMR